MICDECKAAGLKSRIYGGDCGFSTSMGSDSYYDEDGKRHHHDPNSVTYEYRCSNGHRWGVKEYKKCWCGYNGGKNSAWRLEPTPKPDYTIINVSGYKLP